MAFYLPPVSSLASPGATLLDETVGDSSDNNQDDRTEEIDSQGLDAILRIDGTRFEQVAKSAHKQ